MVDIACGSKIQTKRCFDSTYNHIIVPENAQHAYQITEHDISIDQSPVIFQFVCKKNSTLTVELFLVGARSSTLRVELLLEGQGAYASLFGACALTGNAQQTVEIVQQHMARYTTSVSNVHVVLDGEAMLSYDGKITILKDAHHADAALYNKNIVLSGQARAVAVPSLEVHTNRVHCKHGTATGQFDQDQLHYMRSRGIGMEKARQLLLQSFFTSGNRSNFKQVDRLIKNLV